MVTKIDRGKRAPACSHVLTLARFAARVPSIGTLEELLEAVVEVASTSIAADSVRLGRIGPDHPRLSGTIEQATPWCGTQGTSHVLSVPVVSSGEVWGELVFSRLCSAAFSETDEAVAGVVAGLTTAGLARVLGDERLRELAYGDSLTGLANRRAADEKLEAWASDPLDALDLTVVLCDVNGLKRVNDNHGHLVGDRLLQDVARCVSAAAARLPRGFAARIGGDEFLVAVPCADQALVAGVVAELSQTVSLLPYGDGLSCGAAWAGALLRPETSPQSLVRSLLRIADSEQYRHKLATRRHAPDAKPDKVAVTWSSRRHRDPDPALAAPPDWLVDDCDGTSVEGRLSRVAHVICGTAGGVAWWVSAVDLTRGEIQGSSCGIARAGEITDGLWPPVVVDPTLYLLTDFPATARAVQEGAAFCVDTLIGDPAERQLLIQNGFQTMIAAGGISEDGRGWLIEICGDSLTTDLHEWTSSLCEATTRALVASSTFSSGQPMSRAR